MNITEYTRMAERERGYWWHVGRLAIIDSWIKRWLKPNPKSNVLNVGCGTGGTLPVLEKYGKVTNVDVSDEAIKFMKTAGYKAQKVSDHRLPYKDNSFDIVVAFDVLEHIENHRAALIEWSRVLRPGGSILITVPAYQWLWSDHDVSLHHHRRYVKSDIEDILPANTRVRRSSYCVVFSLPLVVGFRFMNKILRRRVDSETSYVNLPRVINNLFISLLRAEGKAHTVLKFPIGTSLITHIRKN